MASEAFNSTCSHCGSSKLLDSEFASLYENGYPKIYVPCSCDQAKSRRLLEENVMESETKRRQRKRHELLLTSCGVPTRFPQIDCEDEYAAVRMGMWLYVHGGVGSGKTTLAASIAKRWIEDNGATVSFVAATNMLDDERARLYGRKSAEACASEYETQRLLIIDDIGQEVPTAWVLSRLFTIINSRYEHELPTVITSQFNLGKLGQRLAVQNNAETALAIVSRIKGEASIEHLERKDQRLRRTKMPKE